MKKLCLTAVIAVFLLFITNGIQGQTAQTQLDQLKLMEQFIGTWQAPFPKDTIIAFEMQQFGKAFVENDYVTVKGKKSLDSKWSYSFSPKEGKFKIFAVYFGGNYYTWIGSFTSEKKWVQEMVQDFNPEKVLMKAEMVFETTTSISVSAFDMKGVKIFEFKWTKVK
jgi:hypothetical protein